jgi:hypothetical protein
MEINNNAVFEELSSNQVRDLQLGMKHFFVNYPHEEVKRIIWELYRGWVFNSAEYVQQEEITDMLLFYEAILEFTRDTHNTPNTWAGLF